MQFSQSLVIHMTGKFREPVVDRRKHPQHNRIKDHIVKVSNDEVGVAHMNINRHRAQHHSCNTGKDEVKKTTEAEEHRRSQPQLASP